MIITYSRPKWYTKEVRSEEHDKCLKGLESLVEMWPGLQMQIEKRYSAEGWELIVRNISGSMFYACHGKWEEDIGEEVEIPDPVVEWEPVTVSMEDWLNWGKDGRNDIYEDLK